MQMNSPRGRRSNQLTEGSQGSKGGSGIFASLLLLRPSAQNARARRQRRLNLERLEGRMVLSSFALSFGGAGDEATSYTQSMDSSGNTYLSGALHFAAGRF